MNTKTTTLTTILFLIIHLSHAQDIIKKGSFEVQYPTESDRFDIQVMDRNADKPVDFSSDGTYILQYENRENYKIKFQVKDKMITSDILILNYRPGDSIIIKQEHLKFKSSKRYTANYLRSELTYLKDSIFSYKEYFTGARYEGKTKLTPHGFRNVEHKEFDGNNLLAVYNYSKDRIYYQEQYIQGILKSRKYIKAGEHIILLFDKNKIKAKQVYKYIDGKYFIYAYNANNVLTEKKPIDEAAFEKEFPGPVGSF